MPKAKEKVTICNKLGMHARPAGAFIEEANKFQSKITVCLDDINDKGQQEHKEADGKSILELLMLCAVEGKTIEITAEGNDADQAVQALVNLVKDRFREER